MARKVRSIAGRPAVITGAASGIGRGKARILVGPDANVFDTLARVTPTHYYDVMAVLEKRLRTRASQRASASPGLPREPKGRGPAWTDERRSREPKGRGPAWTDERRSREPKGRGPAWTDERRSREPKGRGPAWTDERRRSEEGRRGLKGGPEASGIAEREEGRRGLNGGPEASGIAERDEGRKRLKSAPEASEKIQ
jgi:hypothetical protein